jgi:histone H3/H4
MKDCKENQIRNPETGRCVLKTSPKGKQILKKKGSSSRRASPGRASSSSRRASPRRVSPKSQKPCREDKIRNPETGRCVLKSSPKGKQILKAMGAASRRASSPKIPRASSRSSSRKSRKGINFDKYILIVLKQVHPDLSIDENTMKDVNYFLNLVGVALVKEAVSTLSGKIILTDRNVRLGIENFLTGNLKTHAIFNGQKAVTTFTTAIDRGTRESKAGLQFSISLAEKIIRHNYNGRVGAVAPIYLAGVLEYFAAELLELSGNLVRDSGKNTIEVDYLKSAIENDGELKKLAKDINF